MDFLKRCPACGRRFGVTRGLKTLVDTETGVLKEEHLAGSPYGGPGGKGTGVWVEVEGNVPVEYDRYKVKYSCKSCHHEWTESVTEPRRSS